MKVHKTIPRYRDGNEVDPLKKRKKMTLQNYGGNESTNELKIN